MQAFYYGIANTTILFTVLFAILSIFILGKSNRVNNQLMVYIIVAGSIEIVSFIFAEFKMNNLRFIHLYTIVEFVLLSTLFRRIIVQLKGQFDIQLIYIPVLFLLILNTLFLQGLNIYNSIASTLSSLTIVGFCIYSFSLLLNSSSTTKNSSIKLILIAIFIYHASALSIMLFSNLILQLSSDQKLIIWIFRATLTLITKLLLFVVLGKVAYNLISRKAYV